jgi:hypothetical protein
MAKKEIFLEDLTKPDSKFSLGKQRCSVCHEAFPPKNWPLETIPQYNPGERFLLHADEKHKAEDGFEFRVPVPDEPVRLLISRGVMGTRFVSQLPRDDANQTIRVYSDNPSVIGPSISWKVLAYRPRRELVYVGGPGAQSAPYQCNRSEWGFSFTNSLNETAQDAAEEAFDVHHCEDYPSGEIA